MLAHHFQPRHAQEISVSTDIVLSDIQRSILQLCAHDHMTIDGLLSQISTDVSGLLEALTVLEMYGLVMQ